MGHVFSFNLLCCIRFVIRLGLISSLCDACAYVRARACASLLRSFSRRNSQLESDTPLSTVEIGDKVHAKLQDNSALYWRFSTSAGHLESLPKEKERLRKRMGYLRSLREGDK